MDTSATAKQVPNDPDKAQAVLIAKLQRQLAEQGAQLQRAAEQVQGLLRERAGLQAQLVATRRELTKWKGMAALGTLLGLTFGSRVR
jgi:C4-dicarboxylate-specific signal transduction histidine kinase